MDNVVLTNMCMIEDGQGRVLLQERTGVWPGLAFPGGHVEPGESFVGSVIREVWEETGLTLERPRLCGIKQFPTEDGRLYIGLYFKASHYSGQLRDSSEGRVLWMDRQLLPTSPLSDGLLEALPVFEQDDLSEVYCRYVDGQWCTTLL